MCELVWKFVVSVVGVKELLTKELWAAAAVHVAGRRCGSHATPAIGMVGGLSFWEHFVMDAVDLLVFGHL